jgi:hypothetical protein
MPVGSEAKMDEIERRRRPRKALERESVLSCCGAKIYSDSILPIIWDVAPTRE